MAIIANKPESNEFAKVEPGTYIARCYSMIEIGTVLNEFNGETKERKMVSITWELPEELAVFHEEKGPEPYVVSKSYTLSMHEKSTLRKDLESWRGRGFTEAEAAKFDITKLIGVPCLITITHKPGVQDPTKVYATISAISKLMKGQECPPQVNKTRILSYDNFDWNIFESLSEFMKEKIKSSQEFKTLQEPGTVHASASNEEPKDDLPF